MYTPSLPPQRNETAPRSTHLHQPDETLSEHEKSQTFKTYLAGRHLAYSAIVSDIHEKLTNARKIQERNPHDSALWAITEGQIEGLKEILTLLQNSQERNAPTS